MEDSFSDVGTPMSLQAFLLMAVYKLPPTVNIPGTLDQFQTRSIKSKLFLSKTILPEEGLFVELKASLVGRAFLSRFRQYRSEDTARAYACALVMCKITPAQV